jgi:hypothetical protein
MVEKLLLHYKLSFKGFPKLLAGGGGTVFTTVHGLSDSLRMSTAAVRTKVNSSKMHTFHFYLRVCRQDQKLKTAKRASEKWKSRGDEDESIITNSYTRQMITRLQL